jgi:hypothetical protein
VTREATREVTGGDQGGDQQVTGGEVTREEVTRMTDRVTGRRKPAPWRHSSGAALASAPLAKGDTAQGPGVQRVVPSPCKR